MTSKYHNVKHNGFDSKKEEKRWHELRALEDQGVITNLQRQAKFEVLPHQVIDGKVVERAVNYIADFYYFQDGQPVVEDVKGYIRTPEYVIKRKLLLKEYGIRIKEI